jgi:hypothetical protein
MRTILFVLALLGAVVGRGQIVLDWYTPAATGGGLLLDDYPNAAAAYSLRLLNSAYTGNCIEVRKASDNTTQNIGFAGGVLDTAALKTFCASTNCFVRTWYDQSLNARHATQTTDANQPRIVASGALNTINGRIAIRINDNSGAITQHLIMPVYHTASDANIWAFTVTTTTTGDPLSFGQIINSDPTDRGLLILLGSSSAYSPLRTFAIRSTSSGPANITAIRGTTYLRVDNANRTNINIWANNVAGTSAADSNTNFNMPNNYIVGNALVGAVQNTTHFTEMIFYNTDQSSNRTGIQSNINAFYTIY